MKKDLHWIAFLFAWIFANTLGWFLYSSVILPVWKPIATLVIAPLAIGFFQYLLLRKFIGISQLWIWASLLVYGVFVVSALFVNPYAFSFKITITAFLTFGILGLTQKKILDYYTNHTRHWMWINALSAIFGLFFSIIFEKNIFPNGTIPTFWALFGAIYGFFTGLGLIFMKFSEPASSSPLTIESK